MFASRCAEKVIVFGLFKTEWSRGEVSEEYYGGEGYEPSYLLRYSIPVIPIIIPPPGTPESVKEAINSASELIWIDPGAAGNRLRYAVELLLTDRKVSRFTIDKDRKRVSIKTHDRIVSFKKSQPEAGEALEAVKWIGNAGSHEGSLTVHDVLDASGVLDHALWLVYGKDSQTLQRHIKSVIKARGVPKKGARILYSKLQESWTGRRLSRQLPILAVPRSASSISHRTGPDTGTRGMTPLGRSPIVNLSVCVPSNLRAKRSICALDYGSFAGSPYARKRSERWQRVGSSLP